MKNFWDSRYKDEAYVYGTNPNTFFAEELLKLTPGKILLPGEGEGRNAVFAAKHMWDVEAFDSSIEGQKKAVNLARKLEVEINYSIQDYNSFNLREDHYDVIGLIFTHMMPDMRGDFHKKLIKSLKTGGKIISETFSKTQLGNTSGGPPSLEMLHSIEELTTDFHGLTIDLLEEKDVPLSEGPFHQGIGSVLRLVATKG